MAAVLSEGLVVIGDLRTSHCGSQIQLFLCRTEGLKAESLQIQAFLFQGWGGGRKQEKGFLSLLSDSKVHWQFTAFKLIC